MIGGNAGSILHPVSMAHMMKLNAGLDTNDGPVNVRRGTGGARHNATANCELMSGVWYSYVENSTYMECFETGCGNEYQYL